MSTTVYPLAGTLPLQKATYRLWMIRHLMREHAMDPAGAESALSLLRDHPNGRIAALARHTTATLAAPFTPGVAR